MAIRPRKRFGQHFLEAAWVEKVVTAIEPRPDDTFLEIGSGQGALTLPLARRAARVLAVEVDRDLAAALRTAVPGNVEVVDADVLGLDLAALVRGRTSAPSTVRVAGNLPYYISSPILFQLLKTHRSSGTFSDATLLLQEEVADRIVAVPGSGDYGVLAILTQLHADVMRLLRVPPGAFRPTPTVSSALVRLTFRPPRVALRDEATFEELVRVVFQQRRKTVANALRRFGASRHRVSADVLLEAGIDPRRRPETLSIEELARLAHAFSAVLFAVSATILGS